MVRGRPLGSKSARTLEIEQKLREGETPIAIAEEYGVTREAIYHIRSVAGLSRKKPHLRRVVLGVDRTEARTAKTLAIERSILAGDSVRFTAKKFKVAQAWVYQVRARLGVTKDNATERRLEAFAKKTVVNRVRTATKRKMMLDRHQKLVEKVDDLRSEGLTWGEIGPKLKMTPAQVYSKVRRIKHA